MNDSQLIERLADTDLYRNDRPLPETMRPDIGLLEIARSTDMDTMERVEVIKPPQRRRNGPLMAAAFALVIVVGLAGALLATRGGDTEPANPTTTAAPPTTTEAPPTTVATEPVDIDVAAPIQVQNDQASRATIEFAGNAEFHAQVVGTDQQHVDARRGGNLVGIGDGLAGLDHEDQQGALIDR